MYVNTFMKRKKMMCEELTGWWVRAQELRSQFIVCRPLGLFCAPTAAVGLVVRRLITSWFDVPWRLRHRRLVMPIKITCQNVYKIV